MASILFTANQLDDNEGCLHSGSISLKPLYEFVQSDPRGEALDGRSPKGRIYFHRADDVSLSIAEVQGFYLWGYYERGGLWRNLYLGKAGFGKTAHLRSRIREELKDERCFLWGTGTTPISKQSVIESCRRHYPTVSDKQWNRYLLKAGATHVVWVSDASLSNDTVGGIESDLIETLNPRANASRPAPHDSFQAHTREVIRRFRERIHENRDSRF